MGMKIKEQRVAIEKGVKVALALPPIPEVPKAPVKAVEQVVTARERAGDDKMLSDRMTKQDWADKSIGISIDAIHKSSLEGNTLAQATIGLSFPEVLKRTEEFVRFNIELNKKIKSE